jgi:hypothetical protein
MMNGAIRWVYFANAAPQGKLIRCFQRIQQPNDQTRFDAKIKTLEGFLRI